MPTILLKKSDTASAVPSTANLTNLAGGAEVAVNTADRRLFTMNSSSAVVELGTNPTTLSTASLTVTTGNAAFTGTAQRITGDMSNATFSSRLAFQSSTTNGNTTVNTLPNGTATTSQYQSYNAADPTNSSLMSVGVGPTEMQLQSAIRGTGTYLPMTFYTGGSERVRIDTSGNVGIGTASPAQIVEASKSQDAKTQIKITNVNAGANASAGVVFGTSSGDNGYVGANGGAASSALGGANALQVTNLASAPVVIATNNTERMRIDSSGNVQIGTTTAAAGGLLTLNKAPAAAFGSPLLQVGGASFTSGGYYSIGLGFTDATYTEPPGEIAFITTSDSGGTLGAIAFGTRSVTTNTAVTERARITSGGNLLVGTTTDVTGLSGVISDVSGNVRAIPRSGTAKTSTYTLAITDVGDYIELGTGGGIDVPNGVFSTGDAVSVFNNTTGNRTISLTITTAYIAGTDSDKASVTLATRGVATILFISNSLCVVSGNVS